jgi:hypothetical protein
MKYRHLRALGCLAIWVFVGAWKSCDLRVLRGSCKMVLRGDFLQSRAQEVTLPESCKSPYRDAPNFIEFYTTSTFVLAARKGAQTAGLTELFAVTALREKMRDLFPSLGEESPMDRLIVAQLCHYEAIQIQKKSRPGSPRLVISPSDEELHEHLLAIAPRLYEDSRKLMIEALAIRARERKQNLNLERQWHQVERARRRGHEKIKDLFKGVDSTSF